MKMGLDEKTIKKLAQSRDLMIKEERAKQWETFYDRDAVLSFLASLQPKNRHGLPVLG
jgi:hypothetical protein